MTGKDIGRPESRILKAVSLFDQLTAEQLARHLDYSFRYTQNKCKNLYDKKHLLRLTLPKLTQGGGVPYVYTLARKGRKYLSSHDVGYIARVKSRYRPSEAQARLHTLATNEVLLQFMKIIETDSNLSLVDYISDREFKNAPIKVSVPATSRAENVSLVPDLWIHLRQTAGGKAYSYCFCIEVNLTPLEQKRWRRKVSMYLNCDDEYTKRVGMDVLQVVTIINSPSTVLRKGAGSYLEQEQSIRQRGIKSAEKIRADYLSWTKKELISQNKQGDGDLFLMSCAPLDSLSPRDLLYSEHFTSPFDPDPVSLIEKIEDGN